MVLQGFGPSFIEQRQKNSYRVERVWSFLIKLKIERPYDPAIPLLGMYPEKTMVQKDTCTPMFTAAQFTIART